MTFDKELILSYLDKILQSRSFVKSKISCDLLSYLVHASIEGNNPKEYTIGVELFGKKYGDEAKADSNIRVYIHNLRKRLTEYYEEEGCKDPVIFEIEKGKYGVRFISRKELGKPGSVKTYKLPFFVSLALVVILGVLWLTKSPEKKNVWENLPVWNEFSGNGKKTLLVLGDYFVFAGKLPTGTFGIFRDFGINSETDFEHLLDKNPELVQVVSKTNLTYLSKMSVFCQDDIYKVFSQTGASIDVKLSSDLQPADLKDYNIIFIGNYKNMGLFENIVREMKFSFGINDASKQYIFSNDPCATVYSASNTSLKQTDYSLVIFREGFSGNQFLFFLSSQDIGNISTVGLFTDPAYMANLYEKYLKGRESKNFSALYKVEGINKTDLASELIGVE